MPKITLMLDILMHCFYMDGFKMEIGIISGYGIVNERPLPPTYIYSCELESLFKKVTERFSNKFTIKKKKKKKT